MRNSLLTISTLCMLGLFGCATTGQPSPEKAKIPSEIEDTEAKKAFAEVEQALRRDDSEQALDLLEGYQAEHSEDRTARVLYAALLMSQGEIDEARGILEEVLQVEPQHGEALFNLALLEGFAGNRKKQLSLLQQLKEEDPENGEVHAALGEFYLTGKEMDLAKAAFSRSLELDGESLSALTGMGQVLLMTKKYEAAEEILLRAAELYPKDPFVFSDLARSRIAQGHYEDARESLDRAVELAPEDYWIRMDRGKLLLNKLLEAGKALEDFNKAVEINPDYFYAYIFRAGIYDETSRQTEAIADYRRLLELRPDYYHSYRSLAILFYMKEEWEEARKNLEKIFEYEKDFGFKLLAGLTLYREGKAKEGRAYLREFLDTIPRDDHFYALARMCIDSGYEVFTLKKIAEEQDTAVKTRMHFYAGAVMQALGGTSGAAQYYSLVREQNLVGLYENRMALNELKKIEGEL